MLWLEGMRLTYRCNTGKATLLLAETHVVVRTGGQGTPIAHRSYHIGRLAPGVGAFSAERVERQESEAVGPAHRSFPAHSDRPYRAGLYLWSTAAVLQLNIQLNKAYAQVLCVAWNGEAQVLSGAADSTLRKHEIEVKS